MRRQFTGSSLPQAPRLLPSTARGAPGYFQNKYTSGVSTVGLSGQWQATDRLKLSADYTFAYGSVMFGNFNGVFVPANQLAYTYQNVTNYPDENSTMNALTFKGKYQLTDNVELGLGVGWSMFRSSNWNDQQPAVEAKCTSGGAQQLPNVWYCQHYQQRQFDQHPDAGLQLAQLQRRDGHGVSEDQVVGR